MKYKLNINKLRKGGPSFGQMDFVKDIYIQLGGEEEGKKNFNPNW